MYNQSLRHIYGSAAVKLVIVLAVFGVLIFIGLQAFPILMLNQEHQQFRTAVENQVQNITMLVIPDTQTRLTEQITKHLSTMDAQYEPQYIQVQIERNQPKLTVQIWYQRPHHSLFFPNPKMFYLATEKTRFAEVVELTPPVVSTPKPIEQTVAVSPQSTPTPKIAQPEKPKEKVSPVIVTDVTFTQEVLQSPIPVMVDFWASWCGPCRQAAPTVEAAAQEFAGQVKIATLNIDQNRQITEKYGVRSIPTFIVFKNGKRVGTTSGFGSKQNLFAFIREHGS